MSTICFFRRGGVILLQNYETSIKYLNQKKWKKKLKKYESPQIDTVEIRSEGFICASGDGNGKVDDVDDNLGGDGLVIGGGSSGGGR